jgi:ribosomal protein S18 acetylase RimI-like enzyme
MLEACEAAAQGRGQDTIWLHVRQADAAAQQLYSSYGYSEVGAWLHSEQQHCNLQTTVQH